MLLISLLIISSTTFSDCQMLRFGLCPEFTPLKDFDMSRYLGTWYQVERYFGWSQFAGKCWKQTYYPDPEAPGKYKLDMHYKGMLKTPFLTQIDIYQEHYGDPATLTTQIFGMPITSYVYQVLSTDYTNYAVEWRCEDRGLMQHRQYLWILSRTPFPKEEVLEEARRVVESYGLKLRSLRKVSQDCYAPKFPKLKKKTSLTNPNVP